ncbi:putative HTH domain DNA-binding protein [Bajunvirus bajun]|uniref:HTH domain DNA-binding protein n=1 Tax=Brevundimonas phage vB_BgoS-Bajun TaxID=2948594 RepID=A0A9E7N7Y2_9CAUD|nr:putative HTH domain DNA-binding protein [Brevundimonas phage vB_BgoS-Bajun]
MSPPTKTPHRVGSMIVKGSALENPQTVGQRITALRLALGLKSDDVAKTVTLEHKSGKREGQTTRLSRPAYNMYEIDQVKPTIPVIAQIAKTLKSTVGYIAAGEGEPHPIEQVTYNPKVDTFEPVDADDAAKRTPNLDHFDRKSLWSFDPAFLKERFDAAPHEIVLAQVDDFSPTLKPGDMAVIRREEEPGRGAAEFVFGWNDQLMAANVSRPARGGPYKVYSADRSFVEVEPGEINILGAVIGKIGIC